MKANEEYREIVSKSFPRFALDLGLCSPRSLNLTKTQFTELLSMIIEALEEYPHLKDLPLLTICCQAVQSDQDSVLGQYLLAAVDIYTPYSANKMVGFVAQIHSDNITLKRVFQRSPGGIRKQSLFGNSVQEEKPPAKTTLVYIVDDTQLVLKTLKTMLISINPLLTVITFSDGVDVLKAYSDVNSPFFKTPRLIFMDLQMLEMCGQVASSRIRSQELDYGLDRTHIAALSAQDLLNLEDLKKDGIDELLKKPFTRESILNVLLRLDLAPLPNANANDNRPAGAIGDVNNDHPVENRDPEKNYSCWVPANCTLF